MELSLAGAQEYREIQTTYQDRLDLVAWTFRGTPYDYEVIAEASLGQFEQEDGTYRFLPVLPQGLILRVPDPIAGGTGTEVQTSLLAPWKRLRVR